jgi:hypothetical protein
MLMDVNVHYHVVVVVVTWDQPTRAAALSQNSTSSIQEEKSSRKQRTASVYERGNSSNIRKLYQCMNVMKRKISKHRVSMDTTMCFLANGFKPKTTTISL